MADDTKQEGLIHFFTTTLWELEPEEYGGLKGRGVKYLQIMALVVKDFWDDQCILRASALSFATILSLVPFFALTFAVLKGLGVQNKLEPLLLEQVAAGSEEIVEKIVTYINNTNMTSLGAIGLVTLIVTVITLLGNIEEAFNVIWGVKETRSLYRKFSDYLSVVISGPILLMAATSVTTSLQSQAITQWLMANAYFGSLMFLFFHLLPYLSVSLALVFLYIFIPNTKVRFGSALIGGILAGTSWQIAQWGYLHFQVGVSKYNAIYGTLSILPVFMVWIYTSWLIVLFGVEVVYAHQNIRTFRREVRGPVLNQGLKEILCLAALQKISLSFHSGEAHWNVDSLAESLQVPVRTLRDLLGELVTDGYLVATAEEPPAYQPARSLDQIRVNDVLQTLRHTGGREMPVRLDATTSFLREITGRIDAAGAAALAGMTLQDLVSRALPGDDGLADVRCPTGVP
jgi:membrane protein